MPYTPIYRGTLEQLQQHRKQARDWMIAQCRRIAEPFHKEVKAVVDEMLDMKEITGKRQ